MRKFHAERVALAALVATAALAITACTNLNTGSQGTTAHVYAVATGGNIYQIDDMTKTASSKPLISTGQNATGELV